MKQFHFLRRCFFWLCFFPSTKVCKFYLWAGGPCLWWWFNVKWRASSFSGSRQVPIEIILNVFICQPLGIDQFLPRIVLFSVGLFVKWWSILLESQNPLYPGPQLILAFGFRSWTSSRAVRRPQSNRFILYALCWLQLKHVYAAMSTIPPSCHIWVPKTATNNRSLGGFAGSRSELLHINDS